MAQNNDSIAIMLLCCRMSATRQELFEPLSAQEFHALCARLQKKLQKPPAWMLGKDIGALMGGLEVTEKEAHRMVVLMERMVSLSYELDNYMQRGIEVITCIDKRYPASLRRRLGSNMPPVLYTSGNLNLFREPVLAFAGSMPSAETSEIETMRLSARASDHQTVLATTATSGLDATAEETIRENGGRMIAWLPGGMLESIERSSLKEMIAERRAAAVSICHPASPVLSQNARARSKCLYASGTVSYVLGCEYKRGDTWEGALEALRNKYTERMYTWDTSLYSGNAMLVKRGAIPLPSAEKLDFRQLRNRWAQEESSQLSVFDDRRLLF